MRAFEERRPSANQSGCHTVKEVFGEKECLGIELAARNFEDTDGWIGFVANPNGKRLDSGRPIENFIEYSKQRPDAGEILRAIFSVFEKPFVVLNWFVRHDRWKAAAAAGVSPNVPYFREREPGVDDCLLWVQLLDTDLRCGTRRYG